MNAQEILAVIEKQEKTLILDSFDNDDAWQLGMVIVEMCRERGLGLSCEIIRAGWSLFRYHMPGTKPDNEIWMRNKAASVQRFGKSSLRVGLECEIKGQDIAKDRGIDLMQYTVYGGGVPIHVRGCGVIGSVAISGAHHHVDHQLAMDAIARYANIEIDSIVKTE